MDLWETLIFLLGSKRGRIRGVWVMGRQYQMGNNSDNSNNDSREGSPMRYGVGLHNDFWGGKFS